MSSQAPRSSNPEKLETRCPRLGGTVHFGYCLAPGEPTPCYKVLDCWWEIFDVTTYLRSHLPKDVFEKLLEDRDPPNRLNSIFELVERFKNTKPGQESG